MNKNLLVITTAGQLKWLKEAVASLHDSLDVLVVDDATPKSVGIRNFCRAKGLLMLGKGKARGLTDSWNMAYQFFYKSNYVNCIISNDDVRFPRNFSFRMFAGSKKFNLIGPLSNSPGNGSYQKWGRYGSGLKPHSYNVDQTQDALKGFHKAPFLEVPYLNGFCFTFSRSITKFACVPRLLLVNPKKTNVGNEGDLVRRIKARGGRIAICRTSYVFHWKQATYKWLGRRALKCRDTIWTHWTHPHKTHSPKAHPAKISSPKAGPPKTSSSKPHSHHHHPKPSHHHHH